MSKPSRFKTALSVVLSAMMVLPTTTWASGNQDKNTVTPAATDGVGVITHDVEVNGQKATLVLASIPKEETSEFTRKVVSEQPENTLLQVSGEGDLVYNSAAWTGRIDRTNVFVVAENEKYPLVNEGSVSERARDTILNNIRKFTALVKDRKEAIVWGLVYSGIQGGFVGISSGSVGSGVAVMTALGFWNSFVSLRPDLWGKVMDGGGNLGLRIGKAIASWTGREMSNMSKRVWEVAGKFATTLTFTTIQAAGVNGSAGNLQGFDQGLSGLAEDLASVGWSGVQNNYNIWDAWAVRNLSSSKLTKYFKWQWILGGIFECFGYMNLGFVPLALASVTTAGVGYLILSPTAREKIRVKSKDIHLNARYGLLTITNPYQRGPAVSKAANKAARKMANCTSRLLYGLRTSEFD